MLADQAGEMVSTPLPPSKSLPELTAKAAVDELAEGVDTGSPAVEPDPGIEQPAVEPEAEPAEESTPAPAAEDAPKAPEPPPLPTPTPNSPTASKKPASPGPGSAETETFTVTFRSVDPSVERMVVRCHKGGEAEGTSVVHIVRAGKGPCKVEGYRAGVNHQISAVLKGPKNYTCFKDGARRCD